MAQAGTGLKCRHCRKSASREAKQGLAESEQRAVHADGREACEDGEHLAAPIDPDMARSS
jgi:hypothetical protein